MKDGGIILATDYWWWVYSVYFVWGRDYSRRPLVMAMYSLSTVPLINKLEGLATQVWFAEPGWRCCCCCWIACWLAEFSGGNSCPPWVLVMDIMWMLLSPGWLLITDCFDEACSLFTGTLYFPSHYYRGSLRGSSLFRGFIWLPWISFYLSPGEAIPVGPWYNATV